MTGASALQDFYRSPASYAGIDFGAFPEREGDSGTGHCLEGT
jgi:hypothetical protein